MKFKNTTAAVLMIGLSAASGQALAACPSKGVKELTGAGATFPYPLYSKMFSEYDKTCGAMTVNFRGQRRSNTTHQSTTDAEARLAKKGRGREAHLAYAAHALMDNRYGLLVDFQLSQASGTAERDAVPELISSP